MRIKVECGPPLQPLKVWFVVPAAVSSVAELKNSLCAELSALNRVSSEDLVFSLDGFELIDSSSIDVVRDGELIT